jgi:DnaJ-class molecular chaperone
MINCMLDWSMNLIRHLKSILFGCNRKLNIGKDSYPQEAQKTVCAACNGKGRVVIGLAAICTEPVEKVSKCPHCLGTGYRLKSQTDNALLKEERECA